MHLLDYRINSGIRYDNSNGEVKDIGKIFARWVETELAWGAAVIDLTEETVHTRTCVLAAEDNMIFTGTVEEMRPFVKAAAFTTYLANQQLKEGFKNELPMLMEFTKGLPLWLDVASDMLLGQGRTKKVCLALLCEDAPDRLEAYNEHTLKDLITATQMYLFEGYSHNDILETLTAAPE